MQRVIHPLSSRLSSQKATNFACCIKTFLLLSILSLYGFNSTQAQLCALKATVTVGTIKCNGGTTTLTVNAIGGSGLYEYSLNAGLTYQASNVFTVSAGIHVVTVRDKNNLLCKFITAQITLGQPLALSISASAGGCLNGLATITVLASGGVGPLLYCLNDGAYQSSNLFVGIGTGTYTCKVKDANGCIKVSAAVVLNCGTIVCPTIKVAVTAGSILCNGGKTALSVTASGGTGPYTYSINGGAYVSSNIFANLSAGVYVVKAKDSKGCIGTAASLTISQPVVLSISASASACLNGVSTITIAAAGGVGPYSYCINDGVYQSSNLFVGLSAGSYTCKVKDANGCIKVSAAVVVSCGTVVCPTINVKVDAGLILCNGSKTSLTVTATGGVAPYTYSVNGGAYVSSNVLANLAAGVYIVKVKDAKGCIGTAASVTLTQPVALGVSVAAGACLGGLSDLTVLASGGTGPYTYSVNGGSYQTCNVFSRVASGTYSIKVKDAVGCIKASTSVVNCGTVVCPTINVNVAAGLILCNGSKTSLTVTASGGVGPYTYSINGGVYVSSNVLANLAAGVYIVKAKDSKGCIGTAASVTIRQPAAPLTINVSAGVCLNGLSTLTVLASGGDGPYKYCLNDGVYQTSNLFVGISTGTYTCKVKDANGCIKVSAAVVVGCGLVNSIVSDLNTTGQEITSSAKASNVEVQELSPAVTVTATPNPYTDKVKFVIQSGVEGKSKLVLYSVTGAKIANVYEGYISAKSSKVIDYVVPAGQRGSLIYSLTIGDRTETGKLINIKN